jgi:hypothetical protein
MKVSQAVLTATLLATASAQSAPGFALKVTENLPVAYGDVRVVPVGVLLDRSGMAGETFVVDLC